MNETKNCKGCYQTIPAEGLSRCPPCAEKHNATEAERRAPTNSQEGWNAAQATQRAKQRGAAGTWTNEQMSIRAAMWGNRCTYCGAPAEQADHFKPLAKGGTNDLENLVPSCGPCNKDKGDADPIKWLSDSGKLQETITRLLSVTLPTSPHAADESPHALPTQPPLAINPGKCRGNMSPHGLPTGSLRDANGEIYTPSSLEDRDGRAAADWVNRVADYRDAKRGLVITGRRDPFERMNAIHDFLGKKGVNSIVAMLTDIIDDEGLAVCRDVLLCPNLLDNGKFASRVEEVIENRLAKGLPTVVYVPLEAEQKKPRFQRLIRRLMATCHHYHRDPLPKRMTEAEKERAFETWSTQQTENEQIEG